MTDQTQAAPDEAFAPLAKMLDAQTDPKARQHLLLKVNLYLADLRGAQQMVTELPEADREAELGKALERWYEAGDGELKKGVSSAWRALNRGYEQAGRVIGAKVGARVGTPTFSKGKTDPLEDIRSAAGGAKVGARVGAAVGRNVAPAAAGFAVGVGGAIGMNRFANGRVLTEKEHQQRRDAAKARWANGASKIPGGDHNAGGGGLADGHAKVPGGHINAGGGGMAPGGKHQTGRVDQSNNHQPTKGMGKAEPLATLAEELIKIAPDPMIDALSKLDDEGRVAMSLGAEQHAVDLMAFADQMAGLTKRHVDDAIGEWMAKGDVDVKKWTAEALAGAGEIPLELGKAIMGWEGRPRGTGPFARG